MTRKDRIQDIKTRLDPMRRSSPDPFGYDSAVLAAKMLELCDILLELETEIEKGKRKT